MKGKIERALQPPIVYKSAPQVVLGLFGFLSSTVFLVICMTAYMMRRGITPRHELGAELIATGWVLCVGLCLKLWLKTDGHAEKQPIRTILYYTTICLCVVAGVSLVVDYCIQLGLMKRNPGIDQVLSSHGRDLWMLLFMIGILSPIGEELFVRRLLYNLLRMRYGFLVANVISSLVFALYHFSISMIAPLFVASFALNWLYERTRSLSACCLVHASINSGTVLVALWKAHS